MKETHHLSYSSVLLTLEFFFFLSVVDCLHAAELADIVSWEGKVDTRNESNTLIVASCINDFCG